MNILPAYQRITNRPPIQIKFNPNQPLGNRFQNFISNRYKILHSRCRFFIQQASRIALLQFQQTDRRSKTSITPVSAWLTTGATLYQTWGGLGPSRSVKLRPAQPRASGAASPSTPTGQWPISILRLLSTLPTTFTLFPWTRLITFRLFSTAGITCGSSSTVSTRNVRQSNRDRYIVLSN